MKLERCGRADRVKELDCHGNALVRKCDPGYNRLWLVRSVIIVGVL